MTGTEAQVRQTVLRRPVGFRYQSQTKLAFVSLIGFGFMAAATFVGGLLDPGKSTWAMSLLFLLPCAAAIYIMMASRRGHLFFSPDHIVSISAFSSTRVAESKVTKVCWGRLQRNVTLHAGDQKVKVNFECFEDADQLTIVEILRSTFSESIQENWAPFSVHANKMYARQYCPVISTPDREPGEGEYLRTRKSVGWTSAIVIAILQLVVLLIFAAQWSELGLRTALQTEGAILLMHATFALWLLWPLAWFLFPKEGRFERKQVFSDHEKKQNKRHAGFLVTRVIPFGAFAAFWIAASRFALTRYTEFSNSAIDGISLLMIAVFVLFAIVLLLEPETRISDSEYADEVEKWNQRTHRVSIVAAPVQRDVVRGHVVAAIRPEPELGARQQSELDNDGIVFR